MRTLLTNWGFFWLFFLKIIFWSFLPLLDNASDSCERGRETMTCSKGPRVEFEPLR